MAQARILIVEDEGVVALALQKPLENKGYQVIATVPSGEEALQKAVEEHPDVVLMDIHLAGDMDGVVAAQHIRDHFHIPVIYLTAYSDDNTLRRAKITDPFGYIVKPFNAQELYAAIEVALYKHQAEDMLRQALDELEHRVTVRTTELRTTNEALQQEIAERKQAEKRQSLAVQILQLFNQKIETTDIIREVLLLIKEFSGFDAIGIRLSDGEDFPYYETSGFPGDLIKSERLLCAYNASGELIRDSEGNPVFECMCGNVIRGRIDPLLPFFTEGGSFWTNSTTDFLASTTEEERQARTRNCCNIEGYESVALVPLRTGDEIIGLLQLNDGRRGLHSLGMIEFL